VDGGRGKLGREVWDLSMVVVNRFAMGMVVGAVGGYCGDVGGEVHDCVGRWEKWDGVRDAIEG